MHGGVSIYTAWNATRTCSCRDTSSHYSELSVALAPSEIRNATTKRSCVTLRTPPTLSIYVYRLLNTKRVYRCSFEHLLQALTHFYRCDFLYVYIFLRLLFFSQCGGSQWPPVPETCLPCLFHSPTAATISTKCVYPPPAATIPRILHSRTLPNCKASPSSFPVPPTVHPIRSQEQHYRCDARAGDKIRVRETERNRGIRVKIFPSESRSRTTMASPENYTTEFGHSVHVRDTVNFD